MAGFLIWFNLIQVGGFPNLARFPIWRKFLNWRRCQSGEIPNLAKFQIWRKPGGCKLAIWRSAIWQFKSNLPQSPIGQVVGLYPIFQNIQFAKFRIWRHLQSGEIRLTRDDGDYTSFLCFFVSGGFAHPCESNDTFDGHDLSLRGGGLQGGSSWPSCKLAFAMMSNQRESASCKGFVARDTRA